MTRRTKAVLPVHFAGLSADMKAIDAIARKYRLRVIEDAAHPLPSTFEGKLIGSLESDATVFSFYATKTLGTGAGGMIATRDERIASRCKVMRLHGIDRDAFDRYNSKKPAWYYEVVSPGFKYHMTDVAASLGIQQLRKITRFHRTRAEMAAGYDHAFAELPLILPAKPPAGDLLRGISMSSGFRTALRLDGTSSFRRFQPKGSGRAYISSRCTFSLSGGIATA